MSEWTIGGQDAAERMIKLVDLRAGAIDVTPPDARQIAVVMMALGDLTALTQAVHWGAPATRPELTSPAMNVGRWLHDYAALMQEDR